MTLDLVWATLSLSTTTIANIKRYLMNTEIDRSRIYSHCPRELKSSKDNRQVQGRCRTAIFVVCTKVSSWWGSSPRPPRSRMTSRRAFRFSHETKNVVTFSTSQENPFDLKSKPGRRIRRRLIPGSSKRIPWCVSLGHGKDDFSPSWKGQAVQIWHASNDACHIKSCLYRPWVDTCHVESCLFRPKSK